MAGNFKALIRIRKWELDEKRRQLGEMQRALDALVAETGALEAEIAREQSVAARDPAMAGFAYGGFAQGAIERREELEGRIRAKKSETEAFRDVIADAFKALKTIEISEANRVAEEKRDLAAREDAALDEISTQIAIGKRGR